LKLEARGEGRAIRQSPLAGAEVNSGQPVQVEFGRTN
jgi:beta-lactam-binding protein with PASTA domain